jgi:putative ABC transport system permease protein
MILSYLFIAFRNLLRKPIYSVINIGGLSLGLAIAGLASLYNYHELSYDRFHLEADKIYRISGRQSDTWFASLSTRYSNALYENQFPEVGKTVRLRRWPSKYIRHGSEAFYERKVLFTDSQSAFFKLFNFKVVEGNLDNALQENNAVVLTQSIASKVFGKEDAIGKELMFDTLQLRVTAVIEDLPTNTHLDFKVLIANDQAMARASGLSTYCMLSEHADIEQLTTKIMSLPVPSNEFSVLQECKIIPLKDLHFQGNMTFEMKPPGNKLYLVVFTFIGLAILLLSCFNFINLSVALYAQRTKEIGIRKIAGATRKHISVQFLIESLCITLMGFPLVLVLIQLAVPLFNTFMGIELENLFVHHASGFFLLFGLALMVGLISGSYPAFVLPRINSLTLFQKGQVTGIGSLNLRTVLVGLQVMVMTVMLSGGWMIHDQMDFLSKKDLGFEREGVIKLKGAWSIDSLQYSRIKMRLLQNPAITNVSQGFAPGDEDYGFLFKGEGSDMVYNDLIAFGTDADYIPTLGLKILKLQEGSSLSNHQTKTVLVNETMAKRLGYDDPIGKAIILSPGKKYESSRIINGVFRDFNFFSLHQSVTPMMLTLRPFGGGISENILVKVKTPDLAASLAFISAVAREVAPDVPLTPEFLDDSLASLYEKEQKLSFFSTILLSITVLLSALGLVGLASYMAQMKRKEIGIRKVLGADIHNILQLVSIPFVKLACIAFILGSCISFYLIKLWLQSFAYSIAISWYVYLYALAGLLILLLFTVGGHAVKASLENPVKSLKGE